MVGEQRTENLGSGESDSLTGVRASNLFCDRINQCPVDGLAKHGCGGRT